MASTPKILKKAVQVGDPVLFYGNRLDVIEIVERDGRTLAHLRETGGVQAREEARARVKALRDQQAVAEPTEHKALAEQIAALSDALSAVCISVHVRVDLLAWWDERGVWVSDGRILSDEQIEKFKALTGNKPLPSAQRNALKIIEQMGG